MTEKRLLVVVPDRISDILKKGEYPARYYNPGDFFDDVHILATNDDQPDLQALQMTVGSARLHFHTLPIPSVVKTFGWQAFLLKGWLKAGIRLAAEIRPTLIRCYGMYTHTYLVARMRQSLGVPAVLSLHGNPDVDYGRWAHSIPEKLVFWRWKELSERSLPSFDHVIAVYSPILPYLESRAVVSYSLIYNAVGWNVIPKKDYRLQNGVVRCICVGRQQSEQKDQRDILHAVARLGNVEIHLYGNGDLHAELVTLAQSLRIQDRVIFKTGVQNVELMRNLCQFDIYVYNSINFEISKTVMEAALVGLPIIHNLRYPALSQELSGAHIYKVSNSVEGYRAGIAALAADEGLRRQLGQDARTYALQHWAPETTEQNVVQLYQSLLATK